MNSEKKVHNLLLYYSYGSLIVLLLALAVCTYALSRGIVKQEESRSRLVQTQLKTSMENLSRYISEEMWTKQYESILMRVEEVSSYFDNAPFELFLLNKTGNCVFSNDRPNCGEKGIWPDVEKGKVDPSLMVGETFLNQDKHTITYRTPISVGSLLQGYLVFNMKDSFNFFTGSSLFYFFQKFLPALILFILMWGVWLILSRKYFLRPYLNFIEKAGEYKAEVQVANQVAHDIRSPLTALEILGSNLPELPESKRTHLNEAISGIKDIVHNLRSKNHDNDKDSIRSEMMVSLVEMVVAQKRIEYQNFKNIFFVEKIKLSDYKLFSEIDPKKIKRVMSNVLNNAVESFGDKGRIEIFFESTEDEFAIVVKDNGRGIEAKNLDKIMQRGFSQGKERGQGLGLWYAQETLKSLGGRLVVESEVDKGTTLKLFFKRTGAPSWFAEDIAIHPSKLIVVVDDSPMIHKVWGERVAGTGFQLRSYFHLKDFDAFLQERGDQDFTLIMDHEFLGEEEFGLDYLERKNLSKHSYLVTSYADQPVIQKRCLNLGVKLVSKNYAPLIPLKETTQMKKNLILIEDNDLIRWAWKFSAEKEDIPLECFASAQEVLDRSEEIDKSTMFFIDRQLDDGELGEDVAKKLYDLGFKELYMQTGYEPEDLPEIPWIKGIVGKEFPSELIQ